MIWFWLASVLARACQMPRLLTFRLPAYALCVVSLVTEEGAYMWLLMHGSRYGQLQATLTPYMAAVRIAAALEAFWWLASCLPRFRRLGSILMLMASGVTWALHGSVSGVQDMEIAASRGLLIFIGVTLFIHTVIGTESKSAMWHAGILALFSLANGLGWVFAGSPLIGATFMFGGQIVAAALWLWKVRTPPTWIPPEPQGTQADIDREFRRMRAAFE